MNTARNHPANCCCEQSHAESHALGGTAWSDSRWSAMDPEQSTDDGRFSYPVLIGAGAIFAAIFFIVRVWS
jgi:hypothetical protein